MFGGKGVDVAHQRTQTQRNSPKRDIEREREVGWRVLLGRFGFLFIEACGHHGVCFCYFFFVLGSIIFFIYFLDRLKLLNIQVNRGAYYQLFEQASLVTSWYCLSKRQYVLHMSTHNVVVFSSSELNIFYAKHTFMSRSSCNFN